MARALCVLLLAGAMAKILYIAFSTPVYGYANNYDFLRESTCTGLYQAFDGKPVLLATPSKTARYLIYTAQKQPDGCMFSSDNLFSYLITISQKPGTLLDVRRMAALRVLALIVALSLTVFLFRDSALLISLSFFLAVSDLHVLLYANTLYAEFSMLSSLFLSSILFIAILTSRRSPSTAGVSLFLICALWLGLSKEEYLPLASLLVFILSVASIRWSKGIAAVLFSASLCIPAIYWKAENWHSPCMRSVVSANRSDTILGAVLPEATNKKKALKLIGLPEACESDIGKNWYSPGVQQNKWCPEVFKIEQLKLVRLFLEQPPTFFVPLYQAISRLYPLYPYYLSINERQGVSEKLAYKISDLTSLSTWVGSTMALGHFFFTAVIISICLVAPIAALAFLIFAPKARDSTGTIAIALGGFIAFYSVFSSVFGDGYTEIPKHASAFLIGQAFVAAGLLQLVIARRSRTSRPEPSNV